MQREADLAMPLGRHRGESREVEGGRGCGVEAFVPRPLEARHVRQVGKVPRVLVGREETGEVRAEGKIVSSGRRIATAEGRIVDAARKLYAHGTTTCLIFAL